MLRSPAIWVVFIATLQPVIASQVAAFRVSKSPLADVNQDTLQAVDPQSKQTIEVFPGTYASPYGAQVMKRIEAMLARVDETDRQVLVGGNIGAGFDRAITSWRADSTGRAVAIAVHYYRDQLLNLRINAADDYGRPEPIDPADYEFSTIAVCLREGASWSCREEELAAAAKKRNLTPPRGLAERDAVVAKLLDLVLAEK